MGGAVAIDKKVFGTNPSQLNCTINKEESKEIENRLDDGQIMNIQWSTISGVLIANLIKMFYMKLPQAILHEIDVSEITNVRKAESVKGIVDKMQEPHKSLFLFLCDLCLDIAEYENENRMGIKGMAVVASPSLYDSTSFFDPMKAMTLIKDYSNFMELALRWRQDNAQDDLDYATYQIQKQESGGRRGAVSRSSQID